MRRTASSAMDEPVAANGAGTKALGSTRSSGPGPGMPTLGTTLATTVLVGMYDPQSWPRRCGTDHGGQTCGGHAPKRLTVYVMIRF